MSFIYNYFFGETIEEVIPDDKTIVLRNELLKEILQFNTSLLKTYTPPPKKKKKLFKFFKKKVKKHPHQVHLPDVA